MMLAANKDHIYVCGIKSWIMSTHKCNKRHFRAYSGAFPCCEINHSDVRSPHPHRNPSAQCKHQTDNYIHLHYRSPEHTQTHTHMHSKYIS